MKVRKKPVVVDAFLYDGTNYPAVFDWCDSFGTNGNSYPWFAVETQELKIHTLEGDMLANPGDYIMRGPKGEFYPCKPDIFEMTYEIL